MGRPKPPAKGATGAGGAARRRSGAFKGSAEQAARARAQRRPRSGPPPLPPQRERFCQEYVKDLTATQAALRAGYAPARAYGQGSAILKDSRTHERIAELQRLRAARVEVDSDFVLRRLLEEVNADAGDLYDDAGQLKPVKQWPEPWRRGLVSQIRTTRLYGRGADRGEEIGIQTDVVLVDRARRLELLGKHIKVNAFSDKVLIGLDSPLQELFKQIAGNVIRPGNGPEPLVIEHQPDESDADDGPDAT